MLLLLLKGCLLHGLLLGLKLGLLLLLLHVLKPHCPIVGRNPMLELAGSPPLACPLGQKVSAGLMHVKALVGAKPAPPLRPHFSAGLPTPTRHPPTHRHTRESHIKRAHPRRLLLLLLLLLGEEVLLGHLKPGDGRVRGVEVGTLCWPKPTAPRLGQEGAQLTLAALLLPTHSRGRHGGLGREGLKGVLWLGLLKGGLKGLLLLLLKKGLLGLLLMLLLLLCTSLGWVEKGAGSTLPAPTRLVVKGANCGAGTSPTSRTLALRVLLLLLLLTMGKFTRVAIRAAARGKVLAWNVFGGHLWVCFLNLSLRQEGKLGRRGGKEEGRKRWGERGEGLDQLEQLPFPI